MEYVEVVNWRRFQNYGKRHPPWIRLYNDVLEDREFWRLRDASKLHAFLLWLIASRLDNKIPMDEEWLTAMCKCQEPVRLKPLLDAGFLQPYTDGRGLPPGDVQAACKQPASAAQAGCKRVAALETETEYRDRGGGICTGTVPSAPPR